MYINLDMFITSLVESCYFIISMILHTVASIARNLFVMFILILPGICYFHLESKLCVQLPNIPWKFMPLKEFLEVGDNFYMNAACW